MDKDVYHISKTFPNLFISILKFSGMLPLNWNGFLETSCGNTLYSVILLSVCVSILVLSVPVVEYFEEVRESPGPEVIVSSTRGYLLTKFVKFFYPMVMCLTSIVAIVNALWRYKSCLPKYLQYLNECDVFLKKEKDFSEAQEKFAFNFVTCCLGFSVPVKLFSVTALALMHVLNEYVTVWIIFLYFIDMVGFIAEIQFVLMCNSLRIRFQAINETLEGIFSPHDIKLEYKIKSFADKWSRESEMVKKKDMRKKSGHTSMVNLLKNFAGRNNRLKKSTVNTVPILVVPKDNDFLDDTDGTMFVSEFSALSSNTVDLKESDLTRRLRYLRLSHRNLCIAMYFLKVMFEYVLLFSIFASFFLILLNSYFAIYGFVKIFILSTRFDVSFWILKSVLRFTVPLVISDVTANTARRTLEILSGNACQTFTKSTQEELQYFCQEIASRNVTISCAFDILVLRTNLVTAAVAAITTYTVILVQLHT